MSCNSKLVSLNLLVQLQNPSVEKILKFNSDYIDDSTLSSLYNKSGAK